MLVVPEQDADGDDKDHDAMTSRPGPWDIEPGEPPLRTRPRLDDAYKADPLLAPLAWIAVLLFGAIFWIAVFRLIF